MGTLVYLINTSLDGYIETVDGSLDWTTIDDEIHGWFNEQERTAGASLYGTRMYDTMAAYWPTAASDPEATPVMLEFARIWNATPKIVFSRSLPGVISGWRIATGSLEEELARARTETDGELHVGGAALAASFFERGLVDAVRLVVHPVVLGAGKPAFPPHLGRIRLRLTETHTFGSGAVYLGYDVLR